MKSTLARIALILAWGFAGCEQKSPSGLPTVKMEIGGRNFNLEVARTAADQDKGLMDRDSLPDDHGMIFIFPDDEIRSFWMKNVHFPLDILFLDSAGRVVSFHQMRPYDENNTSSDYPARYAIELNKGIADQLGVKVGDELPLPPAPRATTQESPLRPR